MVPIQEQGKNSGIGYNYKPFLERFVEICEKHIENQRAKSFAFLFYDFHNEHIREVFKKHGGFAKLDRLSGKELSIFYIDAKDEYIVNEFNKIFLGAFEVENEINLPGLVFFKFQNSDVTDVQVVELTQTDRMFVFQELFSSIESYLKNSKTEVLPKRNLIPEWINKTGKIAIQKLIEIIIQKGIEQAY